MESAVSEYFFWGFTAEGAENAEQEKREKEMGLKSRVC
jgi:hypothetical protein